MTFVWLLGNVLHRFVCSSRPLSPLVHVGVSFDDRRANPSALFCFALPSSCCDAQPNVYRVREQLRGEAFKPYIMQLVRDSA